MFCTLPSRRLLRVVVQAEVTDHTAPVMASIGENCIGLKGVPTSPRSEIRLASRGRLPTAGTVLKSLWH